MFNQRTDSLIWVKSSACTGGNCVQVAVDGATVALRDSKDPDVVQIYTADEWSEFLEGILKDDFAAL